MTVHFIGAGPGAADLLTIRATRLLATSQVCLYAGTYLDAAVLEHCPDGARLDAGGVRPKVDALLAARGPVYERATLVVEPDARGMARTVDAVARALSRFEARPPRRPS